MEPQHREAIRKNWIYLCENVTVEELMDHMLEGLVFTQDMYDEVKVERLRKERVTKFLFILQRRGPDAFNKFLQALRATEQAFVAERLERFIMGQHQQKMQCDD